MNYKVVFEKKTERELGQMLMSIDDMSYEASKALYEEIQQRKGDQFNTERFKKLEQRLEKENEEISDLKYLQNLGFELYPDGDKLILRRTRLSKTIDAIAIFIGLLLSACLIGAILVWIDMFKEDMTFAAIMMAIVLSIVGFSGLALMLRAVNRIMEYKGFELVRDGQSVSIKKTQDITVKSYDLTVENLVINVDGKMLQYVAKLPGNGEILPLITVKATMYKQATLEKLAQRIANS